MKEEEAAGLIEWGTGGLGELVGDNIGNDWCGSADCVTAAATACSVVSLRPPAVDSAAALTPPSYCSLSTVVPPQSSYTIHSPSSSCDISASGRLRSADSFWKARYSKRSRVTASSLGLLVLNVFTSTGRTAKWAADEEADDELLLDEVDDDKAEEENSDGGAAGA